MHRDGPDFQEWNSIETYDISSPLLPGTNSLSMRALNYFSWGDSYGNPAGLIFNAHICYDYYDREETGWGYGLPFPGNNWATYFTYDLH